MTKPELDNLYFDWMVHKIRDRQTHLYKKLLATLHETTFTWLIDLDENRFIDGQELRYRFAYDTGLDYHMVDSLIEKDPCSVLEMMVALALRCEEQIMDNPAKGDRISVWFWAMISSLNLESMTDRRYNLNYVQSILNQFLHRQYNPDGSGGLFTVRFAKQDMRNVEIWYQACMYLNEYIARREKR
ncbi:MAG: hypothetical protein K9L62_02025 [Vallitaleaceae bacterium]|nr:hypothetical protein [Vallitaleaceae bacterium]